METDLGLAIETIETTAARLSAQEIDADTPVEVRVSASTEGAEVRTRSSLGRELQFLVSHTVHHYALIAIASRMQGIWPKESFGVAPSTLKYLGSVSR